MKCIRYRLWGLVAGAFAIGLFAGLLLPPIWLVFLEGILIIFVAFCRLFG
ncbi:MAG: hypothetical protein II978_06190 [Clostridia bacterium]|nr:hypothetical protein [Clostridia bacterium]